MPGPFFEARRSTHSTGHIRVVTSRAPRSRFVVSDDANGWGPTVEMLNHAVERRSGAILRIAVVLAAWTLSVGTFTVTAPPAAASCMPAEHPRLRLAESPAAFVGRLVSLPDEPEPGTSFDNTALWHFEVESWVKGDLGSEVDVLAPLMTSVDFGFDVGERVGILLRMEDGVPSSSDCEVVDPDALLAAAAPVEGPDGSGPLALLLGGAFGGGPLMALDSEGGLLGYGPGNGTVHAFDVCPGSRFGVEVHIEDILEGTATALRRDLATLEIVEQVPLETGWPGAVVCRGEEGVDSLLLTATGSGEPGDPLEGRLVSPFPTPTVVGEGEWLTWGSIMTEEVGFVLGRYQDMRLSAVDLSTGEMTTMRELWTDGGDRSDLCCADFHSFSLSPDGSLLAITDWKATDEIHSHVLTVVDVASGVEVAQTELGAHGGEDTVRWVDDLTLTVVSTSEYPDEEYPDAAGLVRLFELPSLDIVDEWTEFNLRPLLVDDGRIYAVDGAKLVSVPVRGGETTVVRTLDSSDVTALMAVEGGLHVTVEGQAAPSVTDTVPPVTLSADATQDSGFDAQTPSGQGDWVPLALLGGLLIITAGLAIVWYRRGVRGTR